MSTPTELCPTFLSTGLCANRSCTYRHNVPSCRLCGLVFETLEEYDEHATTKNHRNRVQGESGALVYCSICKKYITGLKNWASHVASRRHGIHASAQHVSPSVEPEEPEIVPGHTLCVVCNRHIPDRFWARHPQQPKHKEKERFAAFRTALDEAEKDKHGVSLSGDFDFKIVETLEAQTGVKRRGTIQSSVPSSHIKIVELKLASSKGTTTSSP